MKTVDNYNTKYKIWAEEKKIVAFPQMILPFKFSAQKFNSYEEMNSWKEKIIIEIAKCGGVKWSK